MVSRDSCPLRVPDSPPGTGQSSRAPPGTAARTDMSAAGHSWGHRWGVGGWKMPLPTLDHPVFVLCLWTVCVPGIHVQDPPFLGLLSPQSRNHHTVFHSSCAILHSHQRCSRVIITPLPCPQLLFSMCLFFNNSHPDGWEAVSHCGFNLYFSND